MPAPLIIALPCESRSGELRVALDPAVTRELRRLPGVELVIQAGCGRGAGFADAEYEASRTADSFESTVDGAALVVKVAPPTVEEAAALPPGSVLVCTMSPFQNLPAIDVLQQRNVTTLAMDLVPRITRAQSMDVLSSQATVSGYKAALMAADLCPRLFPMMITAAGTVRPSQIVVIGAGVGGLQAIATCRRLGARVAAYDIRRAAKEQIESLGARMIDTGVEAESQDGYARALTRAERETQHDVLARHLREAHAVICAAAIPGRTAPRIVTTDMVDGMMADTVIIDMAADTGGNCELTVPGQSVMHGGTVIVGPLNLPSRGTVHASEMYARNLWSMLQLLLPDGELRLDWDDPLIAGCRLTHAGELQHAATRALRDAALDASQGRAGGAPADEAPADGALNDPAAGWLDDAPATADEAASELPGSASAGHDTAGAAVPPVMPAAAARSAADTPEEEPADDFTRIRGVGPALNNSLKAFGFLRFRQLAELDAKGIEQLERQLELDGHILRDDWPGQARRLARSHWKAY